MTARSILLVLTADPVLARAADDVVAPFGWLCRQAEASAEALAVLAEAPAAVLVDQRLAEAPGLIDGIRAQPAPINGTPILTAGDSDHGAGKQVDLPLDAERFLAIMRQWAGPLADHGLRAEPWNFRYRLLRLIGLDNADAMLVRLRVSLQENIAAALAEGAAISAHRLAGLAGICGLAEVSQAWARVDRREEGALTPALEASHRAIAEIDAALKPT